MKPTRPASLLGAFAFFCGLLPSFSLDLYISNVPPLTTTVTPIIDNLGGLKRYHLKDQESAESLQVSCFVGANQNCVQAILGDPPVFTFIPGPLPSTVEVEFSLINASDEVLRSVTATYDVTWTPSPFNLNCTGTNTVQAYTSPIASTELPLSGLDLPADTYRVQARVDPSSVVNETDETNNSRPSEDSFNYRIYSGDLIYGPLTTHLTQLDFSGICIVPTVPVAQTSVAEWTHDFGTTVFNPRGGCYSIATSEDGFSVDLIATAGLDPVPIGTLSGETPSGMTASLLGVTLDHLGPHYDGASVELPEDVSIHRLANPANVGIGPAPRGEGTVFFNQTGDFVEIFDIAETFSNGDDRFYHAYGLPFTVFCSTSEFVFGNDDPLQIRGLIALHNHFGRYASCNPRDPRAAQNQGKAFPLNDIYFMGIAGGTPDGQINPQGIQLSQINFGGLTTAFLKQPRTSFPQGRLFFSGFTASIANSQLQQDRVPIERFEMTMRRRCPDDTCGDAAGPRLYTAQIVDGSAHRTSDGSLSAPFTMLGSNTEWGKFEGPDAGYRRDDSAVPGVFYMPGYHCPGTADETGRTVSQVLLGSRLYDGPGNSPSTLSPLREGGPSANSNRGNGFYAGLTMGPESLAGLDVGEGNLLVDDQDIRFNGNANYDSFEITDYTKYFIRPSGVTGVFNTTFMGELNIYGYDIDFRRFAFRQVYNKLDGKTFLDGAIDIPYPSDITVSFLELDLTCSGDLGSGVVDSEPEDDWRYPDGEDNDGDGLTDEGNGVLAYWKSPIAINGMAFVPTGNDPDPCANNEKKELQLITLNDVNGIENTLTMKAIYPVNGRIKDQKITAEVDTIYDKPMDSAEPGFALRLQKAYLNQLASYPVSHEGFINTAGLTDVPLFNDLKVHLHLGNPEVEGLSLPNENFDIHIGKDDTANDVDFNGIPDAFGNNVGNYRDLLADEADKPEAGDPRARAKYSWPSAGVFDLNYALNYNRSNGTEKPQFLGVEQSYNLFNDALPIIGVDSVPDYINPERTKFSFGASADVARALNFVVNLVSLEGIDNFLHNVLGVNIGFSLENILGGLINTENLVKTFTGGDLSKLIGGVLDQVLNNGVIDNAFGDFAESVNVVERIPQEISIRTTGVMNTFKNNLLNQATGGVNPLLGAGGALDKIYQDYAAFLTVPAEVLEAGADGIGIAAGIPYSVAQQQQIRNEIDALRTRLAQLESVLMTLSNEINAAKGQVTSLENDLVGGLADVTNFLNNINNNILSPGGALGTLTNLGGNPIIQKVNEAKNTVKQILNIIKTVDLGLIANAIQGAASAAGTTIDTSFVTDAEDSVADLVASLEEIVSVAETLLEAAYTDMPDIFDDAKMLLDLVLNTATLIQAQVGAVTGFVQTALSDANDQIGLVKQQVSALRQLLETDPAIPDAFFENDHPNYNSLVNLGKDMLDDLSEQVIDTLRSEAPGSELDAFLASLTADFNGLFVNAIDDLLCVPIDEAASFIEGELTMILETALKTIPAPTVQDIKNIIKGAILNSPPVELLNENFYDLIAPITQFVDEIALQLTQSINQLIQEGIKALAEGINNLLDSITSAIGTDFDVFSARIDGYAIVNTDELERLHIEAEFTYGNVPDPTSYNAALDVTAWNAENGKGACVDDGGKGKLDVLISSHDVPINISGGSTKLKEVALGFTLDGSIPIGFFGRAYLGGEVNFEAVAIKNLGLEVGVGLLENYLGATASGRFESYTLNIIAFYIGKTCDFGVLERLDPTIAEFIGPKVPLIGAYVRGAASIPIYNFGCVFTLGAGADIGAWYFHPDYGGLVGGSIYGKLACLAALRGGIVTIGAKVGNDFFFSGTGWGGAGIGFCEPEDWTNVSAVRNDSWCVTGDATFGAEYKNGWDIIGPDVNCCD